MPAVSFPRPAGPAGGTAHIPPAVSIPVDHTTRSAGRQIPPPGIALGGRQAAGCAADEPAPALKLPGVAGSSPALLPISRRPPPLHPPGIPRALPWFREMIPRRVLLTETQRRPSVATVELTAENFDAVTNGDGLVLVDFWAAWWRAMPDVRPCLRARLRASC